jgi:hypothetical protein
MTSSSVVITAILVGLLATACGSSHRSTRSPAEAQQRGAAAFSGCMRSDGVPAYPDPSTPGLLPKKTPQQLGVSSSRFQKAQGACIHLVPNGGRPTQSQVQHYRSIMLRYAQCIRTHGVPDMPDPDTRGHLDIGPGTPVDVNGPAFQAAYRVCKSRLAP